MVDLRGEQVVEHIHGGGEENTLITLAGAPTNNFGQKRFAHARIADDDTTGSFLQEVQIEHPENPILDLYPALMMFEIEVVDRVLRVKAGQSEAPVDRPAAARVQLHIYQRLQRLDEAKVLGCGISYRLIQLATHRRQTELIQFVM